MGRGRDRGFAAHPHGLGDPRERRAEDWGGGSLAPQSPPPSFPFSLPKLPGSPWLPRQPLLPGAVTKETPCPPLPLPHHWRAPPPQPAAVWRVGGAMVGEELGLPPQKGGPTSTPGEPPHPKPTSSAPQLDTRSDCRTYTTTPPPVPKAAATPQHRTRWPGEPPPGCLPHPLRLSIRPRPLSSASDPPPIPEEALDHGPLIKRMPPTHPPPFRLPPPPGAPPRLLTARKGAPSGGQHARPGGGGPPQ